MIHIPPICQNCNSNLILIPMTKSQSTDYVNYNKIPNMITNPRKFTYMFHKLRNEQVIFKLEYSLSTSSFSKGEEGVSILHCP